MKSPSNNFDWNRMRAFVATAEHGSLSAAARSLHLTQPTLGRQVAALEDELGVTLFERNGKRLILTDAGADLLPHARTMGEAATYLALVASGQSQSIDGSIKITASDIFSAYLMPDVLTRLRQMAPRLHVELVATNDLANLMQREADIAIRHVRPEQPDLTARLLGDAHAGLYAAQSYIDANGTPNNKQDLSSHDFVGFGDPSEMTQYLAGIDVKLSPDNFSVGSANGLVAWELVRSGFGIAPMSTAVARATPGIVQILPQMQPITFPVWLVTHRELHTSRRIRLVFDLLADRLADTMS